MCPLRICNVHCVSCASIVDRSTSIADPLKHFTDGKKEKRRDGRERGTKREREKKNEREIEEGERNRNRERGRKREKKKERERE